MLCLGCIQVPGSEAEQENENVEEKEEEGSLITEQGPQDQDVRTFACWDPLKRCRMNTRGEACDTMLFQSVVCFCLTMSSCQLPQTCTGSCWFHKRTWSGFTVFRPLM